MYIYLLVTYYDPLFLTHDSYYCTQAIKSKVKHMYYDVTANDRADNKQKSPKIRLFVLTVSSVDV